MEVVGKFFGLVAVFCFCATMMNFIVKYVRKNFSKQIKKFPILDKYFPLLTTVFVKYHKSWGLLAIFALLIHFIIMWTKIGLSITGVIAAIIFVLQVVLGVYGSKKKNKRSGIWFYTHRIIGLVLAVTILGHLLFKY